MNIIRKLFPAREVSLEQRAAFYRAVTEERLRHDELGYTAEHDDEKGIAHLLEWAVDYAERGKIVKAMAIVEAARQKADRDEARRVAERPSVEQLGHTIWAHYAGSLCGIDGCPYTEDDRDADYENECPQCENVACSLARAVLECHPGVRS